MTEFIGCAEELEYYSFIKIERNKRDAKSNFLSLNVDLDELTEQLNLIETENGPKKVTK